MHLLSEDAKSYQLLHPSGQTIQVAKGMLSPHMHAQIKALPRAQNFADGTPDAPVSITGDPETDAALSGGGSSESADLNAPSFIAAMGRGAAGVGGDVWQGVQKIAPAAGAGIVAAVPGGLAALEAGSLARDLAKRGGYKFAEPAKPGAQAQPGGAEPSGATQDAPQPGSTQAGQSSAFLFPSFGGGGSGAAGEIASAERKYGEAAREHAGIEAGNLRQLADLHAQHAQELQKISQDTQTWLTQRQAASDKMFEDIKNAKIDPGHFWSEKSTGSKIMAGIGMVLSGIGSGLTHQPNLAMDVIQKSIDRDLDAQKTNLSKQQNLLSYYQTMTKDGLAARQLAKADMLDVVAANIEAQKAGAGAAVAGPAAEMAIQKSREGAANLRSEVAARDQQLRMQQLQMGLMMRQYQLGAGAGDEGYVPSTASRPIFTGQLSEFMKDRNERRVELPELGPGAHTYAKTPKDQQEVTAALASYSNIGDQVRKLGKIASDNDWGIHMPASKARADYEVLASSLTTELNKLQGLNRLNENEYKEFGNMIPTEREFFSATGPAKIKALTSLIQAKQNEEYSRHLGLDARMFHRKTETPYRPGGR